MLSAARVKTFWDMLLIENILVNNGYIYLALAKVLLLKISNHATSSAKSREQHHNKECAVTVFITSRDLY